MFSQKNITLLLIIAVLALSYQTISLVSINKRLAQVEFGSSGGSSSAVSFTDDGSAPAMVGGC